MIPAVETVAKMRRFRDGFRDGFATVFSIYYYIIIIIIIILYIYNKKERAEQTEQKDKPSQKNPKR